jgi:L-lactate dehydrogenase (FMN-dependent) and related alpha-hydroxy acid dehydrogenases
MSKSSRFGAEVVNEIYREGMLEDESTDLPVSFEDLREEAHASMSPEGRAYVHGGAGSEETFERNKDFSDWRIVPRMLRGVAERDLSTDFLDRNQSFPITLTPLGVQSLLHEQAELGTAAAASELDVPLSLSSLSSFTMEDVSEEMGDTPKMFQFYWSSNEAIAKSFLHRAEDAGYDAIVVTVDAPILGWRERLIEKGYYPFLEQEGVANYFSDPEFRSQLDEPPEENPEAAVEHFLDIFGDSSLTWDDLQFVHDNTDLPVVIKGILDPRDARLAIEHGADAIGVSTHGGRQVDGSITAFEALPAVADEVNGEVPITFDSGVRHAADAYKALALGADNVLLGRPYAYGLAVDGANGVQSVLENFIAELDLTMGLAGLDSVDDISTDSLKHESQLYDPVR